MTQGNWPPVNFPDQLIAGRYRKGHSLGVGGFGEVFYAEDTKFTPSRAVAIKFIHPHLLTDAQVREEIINEANVLARFKHRNILRVIDFEVNSVQAFIVTELAEGGSLAQKIKPDASQPPGPMSRQEVLFYLERIATALDEAHKQNVIHRDIKPANILLDIDGEPLLSDFGFAMSLANSITIETLTSVYGTPQYVAPEVWNDQAGKSSDIYALGVMLYEMLTGYTPFIGTVEELKEKHLTGSIPTLKDRLPLLEYPQELDIVIAKALSKNLTDRYHKATDLYKAFKDALENQDSPLQKPVIQNPKAITNYTSNPFYPELEAVDFPEIIIPELSIQGQLNQSLLNEVEKDKKEAYHLWLAKSLLKRAKGNDTQIAINHLDAALKLSPDKAEYYSLRGSASQNREERIRDYTKAIELEPTNSLYFEQRAYTYFYMNEYLKAIKDYTRSFELGNVKEFSRFKRGEAYYNLKKFDDAIADFDVVINSSVSQWYPLYLRGNCYYEKGNYRPAINDFLEAIKLNSSNYTDCYIGISKCYYQLQEYDNSLANLENAIQINPFEKEIYFWRGLAYKALKNKRQARYNFDRAINLGHLEAFEEKKSLGWF